MRRLLTCLALTLPAALPAQSIHCLGTFPGFMMTVEEGDLVRFDYLGDGRFALDPPLERFEGFRRFELVTARERWPIYLETRACEVIGAELDLTLEIAVPTSAGLRPLTGCCRWASD